MKKSIPAESPEAYVDALTAWRRALVESLRASTRAAATLDERIKWGHLVYVSNGPALLMRAEEHRVLFGFWRGQRLRGPRRMRGGAAMDRSAGVVGADAPAALGLTAPPTAHMLVVT